MSDLVGRLRDYAHNCGGNPEEYLTWQAAERIEALEAALWGIAGLQSIAGEDAMVSMLMHHVEIARAVLAPEQDK
jgi:hypothetical protein